MKKNITFTPMALSFQQGIFTAGTEGHIPYDIARAVVADIILAMSNGFSLAALDTLVRPPPPAEESTFYYCRHRQADLVLDTERARDIARSLYHCQTLHLTTELNLLISKMAEEAKTTNLDKFELMFLPFLKTLGSTIQELSIAVPNSPFASLFQQVLSIYIQRRVGFEPHESNDWSRPTVVCNCQDCPSLNAFLANPKQKVHSFRMPGKRRDHILSQVSATGIDQYTDKSKSSPFSLVLTKNEKYFKFAHQAWDERRTLALSKLQALDAEISLKPFLADLYDPILSCAMVAGSTSLEYRQLRPSSLATGSPPVHVLGPSRPLAPMSNNMQGEKELPALSSIIAGQWKSLPSSGSNGRPETRIVPPSTKRKASESLENDPKRKAPEIWVIDD